MYRPSSFTRKISALVISALILSSLFVNSAFALYGNMSSSYVDITDITGEYSSYLPGETIDVEIKTVNTPAITAAAPSQGWAVQYYTYDATSPASYIQSYVTNSQYNATFDGAYWHATFPAPTVQGSYITEALVYCAVEGSYCWNLLGNAAASRTVQSTMSFRYQVGADNNSNEKPNLKIENIVFGGNNELTVAQQNTSNVDVNPSTLGSTYIWIDDMITPVWTYRWDTLEPSRRNFLYANNGSSIQPQDLYGTHIVKACIDALNIVDESNEADNCLTRTLINGNAAPVPAPSNTCNAPYVMYKGTCTDPVPACQNPPAHFMPSSCIDKIENGRYIERYNFQCESGYVRNGDSCVSKYGYGDVSNESFGPDLKVVSVQVLDYDANLDENLSSYSSNLGVSNRSLKVVVVNAGDEDAYSPYDVVGLWVDFLNGDDEWGWHQMSTKNVNGRHLFLEKGHTRTFSFNIPAQIMNGNKRVNYIYPGKNSIKVTVDRSYNNQFLSQYPDYAGYIAETDETNNSMTIAFDGDSEAVVYNSSNTGSTRVSAANNSNVTVPPAGFEKDVQVATVTQENPFSDTNINTLAGKAAAALYRYAIIGGFPDGGFKGSRPVNRAEAAKFLLLSRYEEVPDNVNNGYFTDVLNSQWYTKYVITAAGLGIISGYGDGSFGPASTVNTAEFLKMLTLTFELQTGLSHRFTDVDANAWYAQYAGIASKYNLFPDRGNKLNPSKLLTRDEVAIAIYQYLNNRD
ncbi:MAG: S-layer homology domain-containing protein [Candidatus Peregrinibacteria bacterium]|nr:S-layer homology domain-containing protein [Candidatus Peregrinibacteria bacterium]MDZ4244744.1 S-layer homology domain-containing protein [Candidatus Gracilibacteria bacterium]